MSEVSLEFLQDLLKEEFPDVTITDYEGAPGTKRGDNYTSVLYRIALKGIRHTDDPTSSEEPWQGSIIYKCLPESVLLRDAFKSDELFCNEVAFYNKIWPTFSNFQKQWPKLKSPFKAIPKCYLAQSDIVVLKDLKQQGFVMPDRRQGLSIEQSYLVLKNLSHFHALSLAMKCNNPEDFYELVNVKDGISEALFKVRDTQLMGPEPSGYLCVRTWPLIMTFVPVFFVSENEEYYKNYYREAARNAIEMVEEELQDTEDKDRYIEKFRDFCKEETFFTSMVELVTPKEPLAVICHGDCWTNNFLFRYVDGDIAEMAIVDFQLVRYASPALDLVFIMYVCLDRQQREDHLSSLLEYYVEEMHKRLVEMSDEDSIFHTSLNREVLFDMMQEELKRCGRFGLGLALDMYPIMTCDSAEAPNLYQANDSEACWKPVWTSNEACRRKMTDLVKELVDGGML